MSPPDSTKQQKDERSIGEIETELELLQKNVDLKANQIKNLLKSNPKNSKKPLQAELFASIATLDTIISNYNSGRLDRSIFSTQTKKLLSDIQRLKSQFEELQINISDFIQKENLLEKFAFATQKLRAMGIF
jgi:hypothetical protein